MKTKTKGQLFVVAVPIGNSLDWTMRAVKTLNDCDIVACEDTRKTALAFATANITAKKLVSYYDQTEKDKAPHLIEQIKSGLDVALVSDSGTPLIQDPGFQLLSLARAENIKITPIPGVSSVTCALQASPLPGGKFFFTGFLSSKNLERKKELETLKSLRQNIVLFEAPHRIIETLKDIVLVFGEISITVARELTKPFEEIRHGLAHEVLREMETKTPLGEFVIILENAGSSINLTEEELVKMIKTLSQKGQKAKDILKELQSSTTLTRKDLYKLILNEK